MTREEAISAIKSNYRGLALSLGDGDLQEIAESDISIYVALGMLKLDEPKSGRGKLMDYLHDHLHYDTNAPIWNDLDMALEGAGLKIVEK